MKLGRKDYTISVKTGTDANKAKFKKECVQGEIYHATDTGLFYVAETTAGAIDATLAQFGGSVFTNDYSVDFDGSNDYMDFGTNTTINSSSAFSVSAWFNVDNIASYPTICLLKTNLTKGFVIGLSNTTGANAIYNGVWFGSASNEFKGFATYNSTLSATLVSGWHHLVLTYDGVDPQASSSTTVYIDGIEYASNRDVGLGSYANVNYVAKGAYMYNGLIDEFAIFASELSSEDVSTLRGGASAGTLGVPADISSLNPVGWWRMGDGSDGSGNNDGTVVGGLPQIYNVATDGSGNRITGIDGSLTNIASPNGIVTDVPS